MKTIKLLLVALSLVAVAGCKHPEAKDFGNNPNVPKDAFIYHLGKNAAWVTSDQKRGIVIEETNSKQHLGYSDDKTIFADFTFSILDEKTLVKKGKDYPRVIFTGNNRNAFTYKESASDAGLSFTFYGEMD